MVRPCGPIDPSETGCQCAFDNSENIEVTGAGTAEDPYVPAAIIDPAAGNLLESNPDGLGVFETNDAARARNPARGILYLLSASPAALVHNSPTVLHYDNSDVAGGMTTDVTKTYLITPYAGFYVAHFLFRLGLNDGSSTDPGILTGRISDEDSDGEITAQSVPIPVGLTWDPLAVVSCSSGANIAAGRRIRTQVESTIDNDMFDGDDTEWTAKFVLEYRGPAF